MPSGWWTIAKIRAVPVRIHWSVLLSSLLTTQFRFEPVVWLAFIALIFVHELGHAILVKGYRLRVIEIAIHGLGGHCAYSPAGNAKQRAVIAWGGVLAQGVLLGLSVIARDYLGVAQLGPMYELYFVFVVANVVLIGVNLLPIPPLDGANAWRLVPILYRELRARVDAQARVAQARPEQRQRPQRSKMQKPEQKLHVLADYRDEGVLDEENERRIRELIDKTVKK